MGSFGSRPVVSGVRAITVIVILLISVSMSLCSEKEVDDEEDSDHDDQWDYEEEGGNDDRSNDTDNGTGDDDGSDNDDNLTFPHVDIDYVAGIRGLQPTENVEARLVSRDEFRLVGGSDMDVWRLDEVQELLFYTFLWNSSEPGMVESFDHYFLNSSNGLYHESNGSLYVIQELPEEARGYILFHEYVHALQDQHYDLSAFLDRSTLDRTISSLSLVEGDADIFCQAFLENLNISHLELIASQLGNLTGHGEDPPYGFSSVFSSPYELGYDFVYSLLERDEDFFARMENSYANPPRTSEQILHPEKYLAGESALPVKMPRAPDDAIMRVNSTIGEFLIRQMFNRYLDVNLSQRAAEGWGGDSMVIHDLPNGSVRCTWATVWDTDDDAREFDDTLEELALAIGGTTRWPGIYAYQDVYFKWERTDSEVTLCFDRYPGELITWSPDI